MPVRVLKKLRRESPGRSWVQAAGGASFMRSGEWEILARCLDLSPRRTKHCGSMSKPYYITTAIDYTNAAPHIGHAYEKVLADVMARYQRLKGNEVYFLTGVDQHGQKVQKKAAEVGQEPQAFVDDITTHFTALWEKLGVHYDGWAATTAEPHKRVVQAILTRLHEKGQLYKASRHGHYSVRQEQFLTDKERREDGTFGEEWGEVIELEEANWYFKLSEHVEWLKAFIRSHPDFIFPAFRANDVINALEGSGGIDLCISRPKERLTWGIPLPFDPDFVNYVWFDALVNYVSFAGYLADEVGNTGLPEFKKLWPANAHVIGKDILSPPHAIYWPTMLHAMGFSDDDIPQLIVHGWWNLRGGKISKSLGNVIDPNVLADTFTPDGLRFYLMKDIATGYLNRMAAKGVTSTLSNLGRIDMPEEAVPYIDKFSAFMTAPSEQICIATFQDRMVFGEVSAFTTHEIMLHFFRRLTEMGIPVELATNDYQEL